jgi:hypothetical protein
MDRDMSALMATRAEGRAGDTSTCTNEWHADACASLSWNPCVARKEHNSKRLK